MKITGQNFENATFPVMLNENPSLLYRKKNGYIDVERDKSKWEGGIHASIFLLSPCKLFLTNDIAATFCKRNISGQLSSGAIPQTSSKVFFTTV